MPSYGNTIYSFALQNLAAQMERDAQRRQQKEDREFEMMKMLRQQQGDLQKLDKQGSDRRREVALEQGKVAGRLGETMPSGEDYSSPADVEMASLGYGQGLIAEKDAADMAALKRLIAEAQYKKTIDAAKIGLEGKQAATAGGIEEAKIAAEARGYSADQAKAASDYAANIRLQIAKKKMELQQALETRRISQEVYDREMAGINALINASKAFGANLDFSAGQDAADLAAGRLQSIVQTQQPLVTGTATQRTQTTTKTAAPSQADLQKILLGK